MTRAQYDAEVADLLRAFAKVYDPQANSHTHNGPIIVSAAERDARIALETFVRKNWSDSWHPLPESRDHSVCAQEWNCVRHQQPLPCHKCNPDWLPGSAA